MPVEIMELVIKAKVSDQNTSNANAAPASNSGANAQQNEQLKLIEKTVLETIDILKRKNER